MSNFDWISNNTVNLTEGCNINAPISHQSYFIESMGETYIADELSGGKFGFYVCQNSTTDANTFSDKIRVITDSAWYTMLTMDNLGNTLESILEGLLEAEDTFLNNNGSNLLPEGYEVDEMLFDGGYILLKDGYQIGGGTDYSIGCGTKVFDSYKSALQYAIKDSEQENK